MDLAKPKSGARIFFSCGSQGHNALPRPQLGTQVVRLGAQCIDHWTTEQSRDVGVPAVQLTTQVKSSTLYGRKSNFFRLDGLVLLCIIMGLRSASSAIKELHSLRISESFVRFAPSFALIA